MKGPCFLQTLTPLTILVESQYTYLVHCDTNVTVDYWVHPQFLVGFMLLTCWFSVCWIVDRCLSFCPFSFGHCVVCPSSIYGFWLPPFGIIKLFLPKLLFDATNLFISLNIIIDKKHCEPIKCYKLYIH